MLTTIVLSIFAITVLYKIITHKKETCPRCVKEEIRKAEWEKEKNQPIKRRSIGSLKGYSKESGIGGSLW